MDVGVCESVGECECVCVKERERERERKREGKKSSRCNLYLRHYRGDR